MKTAMMELIDWLEQYEIYYNKELIIKLKELTFKEKEQIIDAYYGNIDGVFGYREEGEEYYNKNYNQNK